MQVVGGAGRRRDGGQSRLFLQLPGRLAALARAVQGPMPGSHFVPVLAATRPSCPGAEYGYRSSTISAALYRRGVSGRDGQAWGMANLGVLCSLRCVCWEERERSDEVANARFFLSQPASPPGRQAGRRNSAAREPLSGLFGIKALMGAAHPGPAASVP